MSEIDEFVTNAGAGPDRSTVPIPSMSEVLSRFIIALRQRRGIDMRAATAAAEAGMVSDCPACHARMGGAALIRISVLMEAERHGAGMIRMNPNPANDRLLAGMCGNPDCASRGITLEWNPDGAPVPASGDTWPCGHVRLEGTTRCWSCDSPASPGSHVETPGEARVQSGCGLMSLGGLLFGVASLVSGPKAVVGTVLAISGALILLGLVVCCWPASRE